jgi:hypothetical protein
MGTFGVIFLLCIVAIIVAYYFGYNGQFPIESSSTEELSSSSGSIAPLENIAQNAVSDKVTKRYRDAYLVAQTVNGFGGMIKGLGIILAIVIILPSGMAYQQSEYRPFAVFGVVMGIFIGILLYLLGVIVSAQGQILKASLDSAVNSSPFLTNVQKGKAMLL